MENEYIEQIILEKPTMRSGVYIILNPVQLCAYVGETNDFNGRLVDHIRSIHGLESSSNKRLEAERCKTFEIFPSMYADYNKDYLQSTNVSIIHETIAMYLIRKHGFALYNGDESGKDNTGYERAFLIIGSDTGDVLKQKLLNYLNTKDPEFNALIGTRYTNWDDLIKDADQELNNHITTQAKYRISLSDFAKTCREKRIVEWNRRVNSLSSSRLDYYKITKENIGPVCYELYSKYLSKHVSIAEMQHCGLRDVKPEELACLANEGKLDRIIVSKFGDYLDQSVKTILSTKQYDIENNCLKDLEGLCTVPERGDNGICFWALRRLDIESGTDLLSYHGEDKGPRYAILPYTPSKCKQSSIDFRNFREKCLRSYRYCEHGEFEEYVKKEREEEKQRKLALRRKLNPTENEDINTFLAQIRAHLEKEDDTAKNCFAFGYAINKKHAQNDPKNKKKLKYRYPAGMFPEVIGKTEISVALLISELRYVSASYKNLETDFYPLYHSLNKNGTIGELSKRFGGVNSNSCASLKDGMRESLEAFFTNPAYRAHGEQVNSSFLLAKLEYPYIIALVDNPIY